MNEVGASPVGTEEARRLFDALQEARGLLVAVSGGPDSMALLALLAVWAREPRPGGQSIALASATVDHGLRLDARAEAEMVSRQSALLGVPHAVLDWVGPKPRTAIQEAARTARYRLLSQEAERRGATHVVTAHHADDQAETVLMRLLHGSGIDGLAGMTASRDLGTVLLVRPLLPIAKARLVATAVAHGLDFIRDPSNEDPRFGRTRVRRLAGALAKDGFTAARMTTLAMRAARASAALDAAAARALVAFARPEHGGVHLSAGLFDEPAEIVLRVLLKAVCSVAGRDDYAAFRLERAERLAGDMADAVRGRRRLRRTLAGCVISLDGLGEVTITRETMRTRGSALFTGRKRPTDNS